MHTYIDKQPYRQALQPQAGTHLKNPIHFEQPYNGANAEIATLLTYITCKFGCYGSLKICVVA